MDIELEKINKDNKFILEKLMQLYLHEISESFTIPFNSNKGEYHYNLDKYYNDNYGYLIKSNSDILGFVLIDDNKNNNYEISELFILNNYKRNKIGEKTINLVFNKHRGNWTVKVVPNSKKAEIFWNKVITNYTKGIFNLEYKGKYNRAEYYFVNKNIGSEYIDHYLLLNRLYKKIDIDINEILDCGSGKTSLTSLIENFEKGNVDSVVFYNDLRKINSIKENVISDRYNIIEKDICKDKINKEYDLVLAHLLLGESYSWGNNFTSVLESLLSIKTKYLVIVDIKEDNNLNFDILENFIDKYNYKIILKTEQIKSIPQVYKTFTAKTYIGYLLEKK